MEITDNLTMRRNLFFCAVLLIFCLWLPFPQESGNPKILSGIWQGTDRLVLFEKSGEDLDFAVVLRVFYGWYSDRASESRRFEEIRTRDRNDAEGRPAERVSVRCRTVFENPSGNSGVYELELLYPLGGGKTESSVVPVAVIEGKLYLDFLVNPPKTEEYEETVAENGVLRTEKRTRLLRNESNEGFWACASNADGITISPPRIKKEIRSYLVSKSVGEDGTVSDEVYRLRYWASEMDAGDVPATFHDGQSTLSVPKFIRIGNSLYQCTTGRSTKIRNIEKSSSMPVECAYDSDFTICALGKPYLMRVPEGNDRGDLLKIVEESNRRRRDPPKPLFPPAQIDFHWPEIEALEKYNPYTWNRRNIDLGK